MSNQDQISKVVAAFEQWRETRISRKTATPKPLRKKAVALKSHYSSSQITSALRISGTQLKQWSEEGKALEQTVDFVQLPVSFDHQTDQIQNTELKLELSFTQGEQLRLSGQVTTTLLATLIKELRA